MKVSLNWLKQYIPLEVGPAELMDVLPMIGLEVEEMTNLGLPLFENLVVGEVLSREQHPDADKLGVCQVAVGLDEPQQIVCGATNYQVGDRVPVALPGCILPGDFKIKKSKLRGVESNGMMCSAKELGMGEDHSGLLILTERPEIGKGINDVFTDGDIVFELELTANRGDCLSHIGVARDVAAYYGLELKCPEVKAQAPEAEVPSPANEFLKSVSVQTEGCTLYTAYTIKGVKVGPSPKWLCEALESVGLRPINNVVDVTNYVLMEGGQPLHAFDAAKIRGGEIIVRQATEGEKITTLDEKEHTLTDRMMVIADAERPLVIAGVMGSVDAEVDEATTDIVLESAWFVPGSVRWTTRRLNLHTDSSNRFTRNVDPAGVDYCARRAIDLILETAGGELIGPCVKVGEAPRGDRQIAITPDYVRKVCGFDVSDETIQKVFSNLGFHVVETASAPVVTWEVTVGSFRPDVDRPIDLVEEFIRIYGTEQIPESRVESPGLEREDDMLYAFNQKAVDYLVGQHFYECYHYSLVDGATIEAIAGEATAQGLSMDNPLTSEQSHIRSSLIPGLVDAVKHNINQGNDARRFFETGRVFRTDAKGVVWEFASVAFVIVQEPDVRSWQAAEKPDFYTAKAIAENVAALARLKINSYDKIEESALWQPGHAARWGDCLQRGSQLEVGTVNLGFAKSRDAGRVLLAGELLIKPEQFRRQPKPIKFQGFSNFPVVGKDLALLVGADDLAETVRSAMEKAAKKAAGSGVEVASVSVFDVYQGQGVPEGKKSLALSMAFRSSEKTLTDKQVNTIFETVQKTMKEKHGYEIRS